MVWGGCLEGAERLSRGCGEAVRRVLRRLFRG